MIGAGDFASGEGVFKKVFQGLADKNVVDAPADVVLAGVVGVGPPGICFLFRVFPPESIGVPKAEQGFNFLPFFGSEHGVVFVLLGVMEVKGGVGDVEVTGQEGGLTGCFLEDGEEVSVDVEFVPHVFFEAAAVWQVEVKEGEVFKPEL